jgi:DNA-binding transcriptional LysR family regulator
MLDKQFFFFYLSDDSMNITLRQLRAFVAIAEYKSFTKAADELPKEISHRLFRPDYQVNFLSTALGMTQKGFGLSIAMPYAKNWVDQHGLVMIPLVSPIISRRFMLYTHKRRSATPAITAFMTFIHTHANSWSVNAPASHG